MVMESQYPINLTKKQNAEEGGVTRKDLVAASPQKVHRSLFLPGGLGTAAFCQSSLLETLLGALKIIDYLLPKQPNNQAQCT